MVFVFFRFLECFPPGPVFVIFAMLIRMTQAVAISGVNTAAFAYIGVKFPLSVARVFVSGSSLTRSQVLKFFFQSKHSELKLWNCYMFFQGCLTYVPLILLQRLDFYYRDYYRKVLMEILTALFIGLDSDNNEHGPNVWASDRWGHVGVRWFQVALHCHGNHSDDSDHHLSLSSAKVLWSVSGKDKNFQVFRKLSLLKICRYPLLNGISLNNLDIIELMN